MHQKQMMTDQMLKMILFIGGLSTRSATFCSQAGVALTAESRQGAQTGVGSSA